MLQHALFLLWKSKECFTHTGETTQLIIKKPYLCDTNSFLCESMLSEIAQVFIRILGNVCIHFVSCSSFSLFLFFPDI